MNATDAALATLVVRPANRTFTFFGELQRPGKPARGKAYDPTPIITHLGCFYPGSMALGVISGAVDGGKAQKYLEFAESMAEACYQLYNITATGLAVDQIMINPKNGEFKANTSPYLQRPEVVESFFYLWRATHNERYREWGWSIMQALNTHCKVDAGYAGLLNPNKTEPEDDDTQQSWFLAETLKYMYLLFSDDEFLRLDEWVFNTEAHPMRADRPEQEQWIDWDWLGLEWLPGSRPKEPMRMPGLATVSSAHLYRQRRR